MFTRCVEVKFNRSDIRWYWLVIGKPTRRLRKGKCTINSVVCYHVSEASCTPAPLALNSPSSNPPQALAFPRSFYKSLNQLLTPSFTVYTVVKNFPYNTISEITFFVFFLYYILKI